MNKHFLLLISLFACGCGESGPQLGPAEGIVLLNGQPLAGAAVMFIPVEGGPAASGATNEAGRFALQTTNRAGAVLGEHQVSISKSEIKGLVDGMPGPHGMETIHHVPIRYTNAKTSGLTAQVTKSRDDFEFKLTSP